MGSITIGTARPLGPQKASKYTKKPPKICDINKYTSYFLYAFTLNPCDQHIPHLT